LPLPDAVPWWTDTDMGSVSGAGAPQFINPTTNPLRAGSTIGVQVPLSRTAAQTLLPMYTMQISNPGLRCVVCRVSCVVCRVSCVVCRGLVLRSVSS
jgi:hypothetical protein